MLIPRQPSARTPRKRPAQTSEPSFTMCQQVQIGQESSHIQPPTPSDVTSESPVPRGPQDTETPEQQAARVILDGNVLTRGELEARIHADQAPALIAEKLDLEPAVVTIYESLYFPARKLLKHQSVIIRDCCQLPMSGEFDPKDVPYSGVTSDSSWGRYHWKSFWLAPRVGNSAKEAFRPIWDHVRDSHLRPSMPSRCGSSLSREP